MTTTTTTSANGPTDPVGADLTRTLRALKLGGLKDTLPERLALARQRKMGHAAFLELLFRARPPCPFRSHDPAGGRGRRRTTATPRGTPRARNRLICSGR